MDIRPEDWRSFLDTFSRQHQGWLVTIEIAGEKGVQVEATERRLKSVSFDCADGSSRAYVEVGEKPDQRLTRIVENPTGVRFKRDQSGAHQGLEISSADGTVTRIRFRVAVRPEMLDGVVA